MKKASLFFLPVLFLISCTKSSINQVSTAKSPLADSVTEINYTNSQNPYDYVGKYHNELVGYITANNPSNMDGLITLTDTFIVDTFGFNNFDSLARTTEGQSVLNNTDYNPNSYIEIINDEYKNGTISSGVYTYMTQIFSQIDTLNNDTTSISYASKLQNNIDNIKSIESNIISSSISNSDKKYLLACTSIYRYSMDYWYNDGKTIPDLLYWLDADVRAAAAIQEVAAIADFIPGGYFVVTLGFAGACSASAK